MAVYGVSIYGQDFYGYDIPPQYRVDPFIATSTSYSQILVSWTKPAGTILAWRLVRNFYGPPTDQDDGELLIDTTSGYPGNFFVDNDIIPGAYHYYGFYVLLDFLGNHWVRSGLTASLAVNNYESANLLLSLTPAYFRNVGTTNEELISDNTGNLYLNQFMGVLGWGVDYLRTQYDSYLHVNDPWQIPPDDLYNLALELGIDINPDIHPYTLRKAVFFNAVVNQQRGTLTGIETQLSALTGYDADVTTGRNIMLENDQSYFPDPSFPAWSQYEIYNLNEIVSFGNFYYKAIDTSNYGNAPTGANTSNTWWQPYLNQADTVTLANPATGGLDTWEVVSPSAANGISANSIKETDGTQDPVNTSKFSFNSLRAINTTGSTNTIWIRSVARTLADITAGSTTPFVPNKQSAVADGIPVPYLLDGTGWVNNFRYGTNDIVSYSSIPYVALRASKGITPPYSTIRSSSSQWSPVSNDQRFRICISGYFNGSAATVVVPFVEWYDNQGNFLLRVFARGAGTAASPALPGTFAFDSFTAGANTSLSGRTTDDSALTWTVQTGGYTISPYDKGCAYPTTPGTRSIATVTVAADCVVSATVVTAPQAGQAAGIVFRWSDNSNYWRCGQNTLRKNVAGTLSTVATHSTPFSPGDRMVVILSGSSITVQRNGVTVSSATDAFNSSATKHGIIAENA